MFKKIFFVLLIILSLFVFSFDVEATIRVYAFNALTGGGTGALDSIDGAGLNNGDMAIVITKDDDANYPSQRFQYTLDADCTTPVNQCTASVPDVITLVTNAGNKRWILTGAISTEIEGDKIRDKANIIPNSLFMDNGFDLISLRPHPSVVNPVLNKDNVTDVTATFVADPFLFFENGTWYMFFEVMTTPYSQIGYATSPDGLAWTYGAIVLSNASYAYSYPQVFKFDGNYYMIPSADAPDVEIYKATSFPTTWTLQETITGLTAGFDPSLFRFQNRWWLITYVSNNSYAYYCSQDSFLNCTWTAHSGNPIVNADASASRGGGRPIVKDDYIIYFYQKDDVTYGEKIRPYKITSLTPTSFSQTELATSPILEPSSLETWRSTGMHTVDIWPSENGSGCLAVVDGHILSGSSVWSIGIYECGTSGYSDDIPQEFGAGKDVIEYFDSADNEYKLDMSTNGVNVDMSISTDGDANTLVIDGTNGYVGIGESAPAAKLDVSSSELQYGSSFLNTNTTTAPAWANMYGMINQFSIDSAINNSAYSFSSFQNTTNISKLGGLIGKVHGIISSTSINSNSTISTINTMYGVTSKVAQFGTNGNQTITDLYNFYSTSTYSGTGTLSGANWRHAYFTDFADTGGTVTNVAGLWIDKQTFGTNNYGIVLNGDGAGADIVLGASQDHKISYDGTDDETVINDATGEVIEVGRGTSNANITYMALRNSTGVKIYIYPDAAGTGVVASATRP